MFIAPKPKTVKGVFQQFTADLKQVISEQQLAANESRKIQTTYEAKLRQEKETEAKAESEMQQAKAGIDNIATLLGMPEDSK